MKKYLISALMILVCFVVPVKAYGVTDVGVINSPTLIELGGAVVNSETADIKIKDGKITVQYLYRLNNQGANVSSVVVAIPKANETSLNLKLNNVTKTRIKAKKDALQAEFPNAKLPKYSGFNLWRLEIQPGSTDTVAIYFEGKYIKGKNLTFNISEEQNNEEMYQGSCKVNFETQKLFVSDIGALNVGNSGEPLISTNETGKASWSGSGKIPKIVLKYKNTKEELVSVLTKSSYKYPRNIGAALLKNDYKSVEKLGETYIAVPATQDPKLNMAYVKYAMAEAAFMTENEISFEKYLSEIDFLHLGSDQLSTRMAIRALEYSKKTSSNTTGESTLEAFKAAKPNEYTRVLPILEAEGIVNKEGTYNTGAVEVTTTPTGTVSVSPTAAVNNEGTGNVKNGSWYAGIIKKVTEFFAKSKLKSIVGLGIAFILGVIVGFYLARRKYRGTNKRSRTVYI